MSTTAHAPRTELTEKREIKVVSHSNLFYWWPVWAVGFLMFLISMFDGHRLAIVPNGTEALHNVTVIRTKEKEKQEFSERDVLMAPSKVSLEFERGRHISSNKNLGVIFCVILVLVIFITNVPLRGLWSVIVIVIIVALVIILALMRAWETIFHYLSFLDIRINAGGYFLISSILLGIWLIVFIFFDRQIYMIFTPGSMRVRLEIGEGETQYDTTGMTFQKQRSDLFRHWILGLGSGDLIVRTAGAQAHQFDLPNVLFVGRKVKEIEEMLRSRAVVPGPQ
jgi:hypothetical protein